MFNTPNFLSAFRLVGSVVLVGLASAEMQAAFCWLLASLLVSDWIDGKLAIALKQQTTFGARLDSVADASMYAALLFGIAWLKTAVVIRTWPWVAAAIGTYALSTMAGLMKYRRMPSYHTRAAKTSWLAISLASLVLFMDGPDWPMIATLVLVTFTNLEALAITYLLSTWQTNVPSLWHAWRIRREQVN